MIAFPAGREQQDVRAALAAAGLALSPVLVAADARGAPSVTLYSIEPVLAGAPQPWPLSLAGGASEALRWLLLALALAGGVLLVYAPLLLTNRVLATGDAFAYFTPYRDYANAALRAGRLPLWNPYLFLGVPFLANPQTAIFYPLHWPFVGLPAAQSLLASLALHLWLAGLGAAVYVRRVARLGWLAALTAGLIWSLSGYLGARAGQINQVSVVAWLPWLLVAAGGQRAPLAPDLGRPAHRADLLRACAGWRLPGWRWPWRCNCWLATPSPPSST